MPALLLLNVSLLLMNLVLFALAPVVIILFYVYFRDKYEKEPLRMLLTSLIAGCLITIPIIPLEHFLQLFEPQSGEYAPAFYRAFIVAAFSEELMKYIILYLLIWKSKDFNEKFDGIVYAVFISLGFAAIENILYVTGHGFNVGITRALTAVPAHALFGVTMGYYFGLARFYPEKRKQFLLRSLGYAIILHGMYDFILILGNYWLLVGFIPFVVYLYIDGLKKMKNLSDRSIFRM